MALTNIHNISLPLQVWLLHNDYDYVPEQSSVSATGLLRSTKQIVLGSRVDPNEQDVDISSYIAARMGHAFHDSIEYAWRNSAYKALKRLGYPDRVAANIVVNPDQHYLDTHPLAVPVWFEQRQTKIYKGFKISGKFDQVLDGRLFDFKSTSVWTYLNGSKDGDYQLQMSIYKWLNPELITHDEGYINFIFTDWQRSQIKLNPEYPKTRLHQLAIPFLSFGEVERYIDWKINEITRCASLPEENIPDCTDKELWRSEPSFKYYSDPTKTLGRSTKNFTTLLEASKFKNEKGNKGIIKTVPGEVKACAFCPAYPVCKQKDQYEDV